MSESKPIESVMDALDEKAGEGEVTVGALIDAFADRSIGALATLLGFVALIPMIGGLPGAPYVIALVLVAAIVQSQIGDGGIWAPQVLRRREVDADRMRRGLDAARPWAKRIDRWTDNRFSGLIASRPSRLVAIGCLALLAALLAPLGLVPAGITPAAIAILLIGLALMSNDGVAALVGYAVTGLAIWLCLTLL